MSKIALLAPVNPRTGFAAGIRKITGQSLATILDALKRGRPFFVTPVFGNDHEEGAGKLRALAAEAERQGVELEVYELHPEEDVDSCDPYICRISVQVMKNLLDEHDRLSHRISL